MEDKGVNMGPRFIIVEDADGTQKYYVNMDKILTLKLLNLRDNTCHITIKLDGGLLDFPISPSQGDKLFKWLMGDIGVEGCRNEDGFIWKIS